MTKINLPFKTNTTINLGLHYAAATGNIGHVKYALDQGQPINSLLNGLQPIHIAACYGQLAVIKYLIEKGADVNGRRKPRRYSGSLILTRNRQEIGCTALHFAAANSYIEIIRVLLENGASLDVVDKYGSTPLSIAIAKQDYESALLMTEYSAKSIPICKEKIIESPSSNSLTVPSVENDGQRRKSLSDLKVATIIPSIVSKKKDKFYKGVHWLSNNSEPSLNESTNLFFKFGNHSKASLVKT